MTVRAARAAITKLHSEGCSQAGGWTARVEVPQTLLRTSFLVPRRHLLTVFSPRGTGRGALWGLLYEVTHPIMRLHPRDLITSPRPHLLTPPPWCQHEFGGGGGGEGHSLEKSN